MNTPLTPSEISNLPMDSWGETQGSIYVSIPRYDNKVFKCKCCGVRNVEMTKWVEHFKKENLGCEVRVYSEYIGDRIDENGEKFRA